MKHIFIAITFASSVALAQNAPVVVPETGRDAGNFPTIDVYAFAPRNLNGGGFGIGGFSPAIPVPVIFGRGAGLRFGADFHFTGLDRRTLRDIPLLAPQTGMAKVKLNETLFGLNAVARLSMPWSEKVSPYVDGFAGLRALHTGITVTPNEYQVGFEESTSDNLDAVYTFQYGVAGGFLVSVGRNVKLNAAVMLSRSEFPGRISNIHTASLEGTGIAMDKKALQQQMVFFKLGVTFRVDPESISDDGCNCCGHGGRSSGVFTSSGGRSGGSANRVGTSGRVSK